MVWNKSLCPEGFKKDKINLGIDKAKAKKIKHVNCITFRIELIYDIYYLRYTIFNQ